MQLTKWVHEPIWILKVKVIRVQGHWDSTFANFFSSEKAKPIEAKFHVDPPWDAGEKICSNGPGTWPIWLPCLYMVKTFKKLASLEPKSRLPSNLVCSIRCSSTTKFIQLMTLGWHWPILQQGQIWSPMYAFVWEKTKGQGHSLTQIQYV